MSASSPVELLSHDAFKAVDLISDWLEERLQQRPVICDVEVRVRIDQYGDLLNELAEQAANAVSDPQNYHRRPARRAETTTEVACRCRRASGG